MSKIRTVFAALAILFVSAVDLYSQSQGPLPCTESPQDNLQTKPDRPKQSTSSNQKNANEAPIVTIKVVGTQSSPGNENIGASQAKSTDWYMIWATIGIGFIGFLQLIAFIVQAIYLAKSAKEMRNTTAAAKAASDDQIAHSHKIERAYMSGGGVQARRGEQRQGAYSNVAVVEWHLTGDFEIHINNHGKTPGELMRIAIEFCDADHVPTDPVYSPEEFHDWIGPGTQSRPMKWKKIPRENPSSAVYGRIYYRDIFEEDHSSGFIQRLLPDGSTEPLFAPSGYTAAD